MQVQQFIVNVNSQRPERLIEFYGDVVGLEVNPEFGPGAFMAGSSAFIALIIESHDALSGATKEPQRVLLNFMVADLAAERRRLEARGVAFVGESEEEGVGIFATFTDPDGNYCQLFEARM
jgi:predicted enzyme related to lactoylglutathione lyase